MRFNTGNFTTDWQRSELRIAAWMYDFSSAVRACDINDIKINKGTVMKPRLKAFMDIAILAKSVLKRLDELITWARMNFKGRKNLEAVQ